MTRQRPEAIPDPHAGEPRPSRFWIGPMLLVLLASPFLIDGLNLCIAQWRGLFGPSAEAATPSFDFVIGLVHRFADELYALSQRPFRRIPWKPRWILLVMVVALGVGVRIIRPGHPR